MKGKGAFCFFFQMPNYKNPHEQHHFDKYAEGPQNQTTVWNTSKKD